MMEQKITLDALGKACPLPVVMMKKALDENTKARQAEILVDNEMAVIMG